MRSLFITAALVLLALTSGCGGGGSGGSPAGSAGPTSGPVTISGYVLVGPVDGATVQLHSVDGVGNRTLLAQTISAQDGSYSFSSTPVTGSTVLVSASGGHYLDPASGANMNLTTAIRGISVWRGQPLRITVTGYSEAMARTLDNAKPVDWSAASVAAVDSKFRDWLGVTAVQDFQPVNLLAAVNPSTTNANDISGSLLAGVFSSYARRLDSKLSTSLSGALDATYYLISVDSSDDRLFPAFIGAFADFIDLSSMSADTKRKVKNGLLYGSNSTKVEAELIKAMPTGVSSGSATAPMPDDAYRMVDYPQGRTAFNKRGALIGYTTTADKQDWSAIYTASVAEMYADGDVGIGRWNGGTISSTLVYSIGTEPYVTLMSTGAFHYAVAKPPTDIPICGTRRLSLVAATDPTVNAATGLGHRLITGLTADSMLSLQYLGGIRVAADIGVRLPDGSVVRYRTPGGLDAPWASQAFTSGANAFTLGTDAPATGPLSTQGVGITALASGAGANKVVIHLQYPYTAYATNMTAVFAAPTGAPDATGCTQPGLPGTGISPVPTNGDKYVFLEFNGEQLFRGAPRPATFGPSGELLTVPSPLTFSKPVYELSGNADASIGRVTVTGMVLGVPTSRIVPYGVVRPGASVPASGTVVYDLIASSGVVVGLGGSGSEVPPGKVSAATFSMTYGQHPLGTSNPSYGTSQLSVSGTIGGLPFTVGNPANSTLPLAGQSDGERFFGESFLYSGAVSAPNGDYAAVSFSASAAGMPVNGVLLFKKR